MLADRVRDRLNPAGGLERRFHVQKAAGQDLHRKAAGRGWELVQVVDHHANPRTVRPGQPQHPGGGEQALRRPMLRINAKHDLRAIVDRRDVHGSGDGSLPAASATTVQPGATPSRRSVRELDSSSIRL